MLRYVFRWPIIGYHYCLIWQEILTPKWNIGWNTRNQGFLGRNLKTFFNLLQWDCQFCFISWGSDSFQLNNEFTRKKNNFTAHFTSVIYAFKHIKLPSDCSVFDWIIWDRLIGGRICIPKRQDLFSCLSFTSQSEIFTAQSLYLGLPRYATWANVSTLIDMRVSRADMNFYSIKH